MLNCVLAQIYSGCVQEPYCINPLLNVCSFLFFMSNGASKPIKNYTQVFAIYGWILILSRMFVTNSLATFMDGLTCS